MQRFPLPAGSDYSYGQRFDSTHQGVDIMAPLGTPVLAVERGRAYSNNETKGGRVVYLEGDSGTRWFYGHLSEWALKIISATPTSALQVEAGDELGRVGNSGNAAGRPPHLHLQGRRGSLVFDPFRELAAVDPLKRGRPSAGEGGEALFILAILWFLSKRGVL